jgi:hypothetical protein
MIGLIVQFVIIGLWTAMLVIHTRRLFRLAQLESLRLWDHTLRRKIVRVWWWLGREEYWRGVQTDGLCCMQVTFMLMLLVWGSFP